MNAVRSAVDRCPAATRVMPQPITAVRATWVPTFMAGVSSAEYALTRTPDRCASRARPAMRSVSRSSARDAFTVVRAPSARCSAEPNREVSSRLSVAATRTRRASSSETAAAAPRQSRVSSSRGRSIHPISTMPPTTMKALVVIWESDWVIAILARAVSATMRVKTSPGSKRR